MALRSALFTDVWASWMWKTCVIQLLSFIMWVGIEKRWKSRSCQCLSWEHERVGNIWLLWACLVRTRFQGCEDYFRFERRFWHWLATARGTGSCWTWRLRIKLLWTVDVGRSLVFGWLSAATQNNEVLNPKYFLQSLGVADIEIVFTKIFLRTSMVSKPWKWLFLYCRKHSCSRCVPRPFPISRHIINNQCWEWIG